MGELSRADKDFKHRDQTWEVYVAPKKHSFVENQQSTLNYIKCTFSRPELIKNSTKSFFWACLGAGDSLIWGYWLSSAAEAMLSSTLSLWKDLTTELNWLTPICPKAVSMNFRMRSLFTKMNSKFRELKIAASIPWLLANSQILIPSLCDETLRLIWLFSFPASDFRCEKFFSISETVEFN